METIQLLRLPKRCISGRDTRSTNGDHKKLIEYTAKTKPNNPISVRDNPSSFNHADITEPIINHGKPLAIPKQKIVTRRLSRKLLSALVIVDKVTASRELQTYWTLIEVKLQGVATD
jgi:hypothetical protein